MKNTITVIIIIAITALLSFVVTRNLYVKNTVKASANIPSESEELNILKPVLYLYPRKEGKVTISFDDIKKIKLTYPKYKDNWKFTIKPKGEIEDKNRNTYYSLYWEEEYNKNISFKKGYFVTSKEARQFLEDKMKYVGLNDRERNDFIKSFLPILEKNGNSVVYFELNEDRNKENKINISPKPDSILRVSMHIKKVDKKPKDFEQQKLSHFNRKGFSVIEYSGMLHK